MSYSKQATTDGWLSHMKWQESVSQVDEKYGAPSSSYNCFVRWIKCEDKLGAHKRAQDNVRKYDEINLI